MTEKIFDLQDNIIIMTDLRTITYANKAFFRFFSEYNNIEEFNENIQDLSLLFKPVDQYGFIYKDMVEEKWNQKGYEWYEYVIFSANKICKVSIKDSIFSIKVSIYNERQYIITLSDISELVNFKNDLLKELQDKNDELYKINSSLEDKLQSKVNELQKLNKELEKRVTEQSSQNSQKDNIISQQSKFEIMGDLIDMLSHQWKQPITAISAHMQGFKLKKDKNLLTSEYIDDTTKDIVDLTKSLANTINDFKSFFKHSEKKEDFKLDFAIEKAHAFIDYSLVQNSINFEYKSNYDITVHTYISKFMQVMLDLFQNSKEILISRSIQNPKITVETTIDGEYACIVIKDNGGGIKDNILKDIFTKDISTKGLGLYMTKNIINEQLKGSIDATNGSDGAEFRIKIPMLFLKQDEESVQKTFCTNEFDDLFESYNDSIENIQISAKINLLDLFVILEFLVWFEEFLKHSNKLNHFRASISNIINYLKVYDNPVKLEHLEANRDELFSILGSIGNDLKILFYNIKEEKDIYNLDKSLVASFHQLFLVLNKNKKEKSSSIEFF
jgi:signal transduction histidine kinase